MIYYADTSWWLALSFVRDRHHESAWNLFDLDTSARVIWTPWQRVEVFNTFYQLERAGHVGKGTGGMMAHQLEREVTLGYWLHHEFNWARAIRRASDWAEQFGPRYPIRGMDLFHLAVARTVRAECFLTFDEDQKTLARVVGLRVQ